MPTTVNMHEAKTQLSKLVDRAAQGEEIIIAKAGKPVAKLQAIPLEDSERGARRKCGWGRNLFTEEQWQKLCDPEWNRQADKEIEDLFLNGPIFPEE